MNALRKVNFRNFQKHVRNLEKKKNNDANRDATAMFLNDYF